MKNTISRFVIEGCIGDMNCKTIIKKIYDDKKNKYYVVNKCSLGEESTEEFQSESDADYAYACAVDEARDIYDNVAEEYEEFEE